MKHPLFKNANPLEKICIVFLFAMLWSVVVFVIAAVFLFMWKFIDPVVAVLFTLTLASIMYLTRNSNKICK